MHTKYTKREQKKVFPDICGFYVGILQTEFDIKKVKKIIVCKFIFLWLENFNGLHAMF